MIRRRPFIKRRSITIIRRTLPTVYHPQWQGPFEKYSRSFVSKHYWRVKNIVDSPEDAVQECAVVFSKCKAKYEYMVDNPRWFMRLYQVSLVNYWNKLSTTDTKKRTILSYVDACQALQDERATSTESEWSASLAELSDEALEVLQAIMSAPEQVLRFIFGRPQRSNVHNQRITEALGITQSRGNIYNEICDLLGRRPNS